MTVLPSPVPHPRDYCPFDVPHWAYEVLEWVVGFDWPTGDEAATWDIADRWYALAHHLADPRDAAFGAATQILAGYEGAGADGFRDAWTRLAGDEDAPLNALLAIADELGALVEGCGRDIEAAKLEAWIEIGLFLIELIGLAVTAALTLGATSAAAGGLIAATRLTIQQIFKRLVEQMGAEAALNAARHVTGPEIAREAVHSGASEEVATSGASSSAIDADRLHADDARSDRLRPAEESTHRLFPPSTDFTTPGWTSSPTDLPDPGAASGGLSGHGSHPPSTEGGTGWDGPDASRGPANSGRADLGSTSSELASLGSASADPAGPGAVSPDRTGVGPVGSTPLGLGSPSASLTDPDYLGSNLAGFGSAGPNPASHGSAGMDVSGVDSASERPPSPGLAGSGTGRAFEQSSSVEPDERGQRPVRISAERVLRISHGLDADAGEAGAVTRRISRADLDRVTGVGEPPREPGTRTVVIPPAGGPSAWAHRPGTADQDANPDSTDLTVLPPITSSAPGSTTTVRQTDHFGYADDIRRAEERIPRAEYVEFLASVADQSRARIRELGRLADREILSGSTVRGEESRRQAVELRALLVEIEAEAKLVGMGDLGPTGLSVSAGEPTFERPTGAPAEHAIGGVNSDDQSSLTGADGRLPIDRTRRYDTYGGLRAPFAVHQKALEDAMPQAGDGRAQRLADPRAGQWFRLANDGGPEADPTRGLNCLDGVLALFDTYVHGRPRVAAPRTFDAYAHGDPTRPFGGEWHGLRRIELATGSTFQNLCPYLSGADPGSARTAVDAAMRNLANHLHNSGHGSFAFILTDLEGGGCHAWSAVNQGGVILFLDPQLGRVSEEVPLYRHHGIPSTANVISMDALVVNAQADPVPLPYHGPGQWSVAPTGIDQDGAATGSVSG